MTSKKNRPAQVSGWRLIWYMIIGKVKVTRIATMGVTIDFEP